MRDELPHVKRPPSEYMSSNIWFTTSRSRSRSPAPPARTIDWIGWDRLLFATDYPHWDFDNSAHALPLKMTETQRRQVFLENAKSVYRVA